MKKRFAGLVFAASLGMILSAGEVFAADINSMKNSFNKLIDGNKRYVDSTTVCHEDWSAKRLAQAQGQAPFAVIVTCSDSRVPPEIIFDQALGDLFVIRVAG